MKGDNIKKDHEQDMMGASAEQCPVAEFGNMTIRIRSYIKVGGNFLAILVFTKDSAPRSEES
jgi:hypothetical protein